MRIIIDMQGAQSTGSRNRGIGRYTRSLVQALVRQGAAHEWVLAFNNTFAETVPDLQAQFEHILPAEQMVVWRTDVFTSYLNDTDSDTRYAAQVTYETFLLSHNPDIILVTSLFEGFVDGTVTSVHRHQNDVPVACILYDLIPYTNPVPYLENPSVKAWYQEKLEDLRRAESLLSISGHSRVEAINALGLPEEQVTNISSAVDNDFAHILVQDEQETSLRQRFGLSGAFVMYTGGADHRKNLEGLLQAYAQLPEATLQQTQLAIVCSIPDAMRDKLAKLAAKLGLRPKALVLTGFVSEQDLRALYSLCDLFVFPSFQEGFGLPALEAMRCGAPVIGSNRSSIPEVIGCPEALFDPSDLEAMSALMARALTDHEFRESLLERQSQHAETFSWDASAQGALKAMAEVVDKGKVAAQSKAASAPGTPHKKLKLAFFSPLPQARSGIAGYSAMLLPSLAEHYDITLILDQDEPVTHTWINANLPIQNLAWFADNFTQFDRVVYQLGNSTFHRHMFEWLTKVPGVVVLHDFFVSGVLADNELRGYAPGAWTQALFESHGLKALAMRFNESDLAQTIWQYPANLPVLQQALGVIVHTEHARDLARQWYGNQAGTDWHVVPLVRTRAQKSPREAAKLALGLKKEDFLVCSFGALDATKLNLQTLEAWDQSNLANEARSHLVFVGENTTGDYGNQMQARIRERERLSRVAITGWVDSDRYELYLQAADIAIQLRTHSRGETSAAVLDCMNHGVATIVNAHGSMKTLDEQTVKRIPDQFTVYELMQAIDQLAGDPEQRKTYGTAATRKVADHHSPQACADHYARAIEAIYCDRQMQLPDACREIARLGLSNDALIATANGLSQSFTPEPRQPRCLLDVTHIAEPPVLANFLDSWQSRIGNSYRLEPIYADVQENRFRFAQKLRCQSMGIADHWAQDDTAQPWPGDVIICTEPSLQALTDQHALLMAWRNQTKNLWLVLEHDSKLDWSTSYPAHTAAHTTTDTTTHTAELANTASWVNVFSHISCATPRQLETIQAARDEGGLSTFKHVRLVVGLDGLPRP